ncbi:hypothetical protein MMC24_003895 [Lignoscripta atroalba]|nr:hypothetical protein [Lignoscripta atroalba]
MRTIIFACWLFLSIVQLVSAVPQLESALLVVGNYSVHGCEPAQMAALVELLNMMEAFIKVAITNNGDPARLAYAAYFNGVDHTIVESMLQKIAYGEAMSLGEQRRSPVLVCARNAGKTVSVWEHCQKDSKLGAFYAHGREFIILCPIFFTRLNPYPISRDCGTLVDSGTRLAGPNIAITQYSVLVHEIAHFYLQDAGLMNEAYEANNCMSLPANESIINPQNYAFYVANVKAECRQFPQHRPRRDPDRELLEVDHTSDVITVPQCVALGLRQS